MNKKSLFVRFAKSAYADAKNAGDLYAAKPWTWDKAEKIECDASAVRAIAKDAGFACGQAEAGAKKLSGLCIKSPGADALKADVALNRAYNNAKKAVSRCRAQFIKPETRAAMTDWMAESVKALKHLTPREMQSAVRAAIKARKEAE